MGQAAAKIAPSQLDSCWGPIGLGALDGDAGGGDLWMTASASSRRAFTTSQRGDSGRTTSATDGSSNHSQKFW